MGHVINPISYRIYHIRYFNNIWFSKINFSHFLHSDMFIAFLFRRLFYLWNLDKTGLILSNIKVIRFFKKINIYVYLHDSFMDALSGDLIKIRGVSRVASKIIRKVVKSFYYKNTLFLRKLVLKKLFRFFLFSFFKNKLIYVYWKYIKLFLTFSLSKTNPQYKFTINILGLSKLNVSALVVSEFFFIRLKQYYTIWEILRGVNFLFKLLRFKYKIVKGYKITCSGRFSRKQRATYTWKSFGSLGFSTLKSKLDFKYCNIALKYSSCTVKVWVRLKKNFGLFDFVV